jgi:methyl coenzyme M reductase subunit C
MSENLKIIVPMAGLGSRLRPLTWSRQAVGFASGQHRARSYAGDVQTIPEPESTEYVFIMSPGQREMIKPTCKSFIRG